MIYGIGTDIVNIKRMNNLLKKRGSKFKNRVFTNKEIFYCDKKKNSSSFFSKRFAAKEAFSKAMGTGIRKGVNLKDIEVLNDREGKPSILLAKKLDKILKGKIKKNKYYIYLSLSDDKPWAQATVIITYK